MPDEKKDGSEAVTICMQWERVASVGRMMAIWIRDVGETSHQPAGYLRFGCCLYPDFVEYHTSVRITIIY